MHTVSLKKKIVLSLSAAAIAISASYGTLPAPQASASTGNIIGGVLGGAIYAAQLNSTIKKYNNTEEGRQAYFAEMKKQHGVNKDPDLNARLDRIMANLTAAIGKVDSSIYDKPYNYFINNEKSFNAFCTLGHNMSVNTGLFSVITNEDEIAVVLGHEMGHGQKDHPAKGAKKSIGPAILAGVSGNNIAGVLLANLWNNQGITKPMEWEADNLAFEYMTHSNYNPGACAAIWQRVMDQSVGGKKNSFLTFMAGGSDHPSDSARRDNYAKKLHEFSGKHVSVEKGTVSVNGKEFLSPAAAGDMSAAERSYFVAGNLAAAFHNNHHTSGAHVENGTVMLGAQPIIAPTAKDEDAAVIAERLNSLL